MSDALEAPQIGKDWHKGGVVEGGNSNEIPVTKSFFDWMAKESRWKKGLGKVHKYSEDASRELEEFYNSNY